jgi:hypothetical protein
MGVGGDAINLSRSKRQFDCACPDAKSGAVGNPAITSTTSTAPLENHNLIFAQTPPNLITVIHTLYCDYPFMQTQK